MMRLAAIALFGMVLFGMVTAVSAGEIVGGGQRLDDADLLLSRIREHDLPQEAFEWYLDLRRYGTSTVMLLSCRAGCPGDTDSRRP